MILNTKEIKEGADIYRVISQFVELQKAGSGYKGKSPLTTDKTASFMVSPAKGMFNDFSAGIAGDSIKFLMEYQEMSYPEALEYIAKIEQISVKYSKELSPEEAAEHEQKLKEEESLYYHGQLILDYYWQKTWGEKERAADDVIKVGERELSWETIQAFKLCMGSTKMYDLASHAKKAGWSLEHCEKIGSLRRRENGSFFDCWQKRILSPIYNHRGKIAGFSGRTTKKDHQPKYLNSPENAVFHKDELLFGLYQNKIQIRAEDKAILVEGPWDVMTPYDRGLKTMVAAQGTALSIEQAHLIKKYCSSVIILGDGDAAGLKATKRNIPTLLDAGLNVEVALLPDGHDPDSILREGESIKTENGFRLMLDEEKVQGIIWMIEQDLGDNPDLHRKEKAIDMAGRLLAKVDSATLVKLLIKEIASILGCNQSTITDAINIFKEVENDAGLSPEQESDLNNYGFFEDHNCYYLMNGAGGNRQRQRISNFTIEPIFLLRDKEKPRRLVKISNNQKDSFTMDIDTNDLVDMNGLKKVLEANGNFLFEGTPQSWMRIKRKIYSGVRTCYPIYTLGQHNKGFYAFGNGILNGEEFQRVDKYGIVTYNDAHYFLPAFSEIYEQMESHSDEIKNSFDIEKKFIWRPSPITFEEWVNLFIEVHGKENSIPAILYYIASLFYDFIFPKFKSFPLLNCFGLPGTGKTFFCWSLMAMFGEAIGSMSLNAGTAVGMQRKAAQIRNALVYYTEYKNGIHIKKLEILKGFYDRSSHETGKKDFSNQTRKTFSNSAVIFDGQQLPNADIALYERVIPLQFNTFSRAEGAEARAKKLKSWEKDGLLVGVSCEILKLRHLVEEGWDEAYPKANAMIRHCLGEGEFMDRIIGNMTHLVTMFYCLENELNFPWTLDELIDIVVKMIHRQASSVEKSNDLGRFWDLVEYMNATSHISEGTQFRISVHDRIKTKEGSVKRDLSFEEPKLLLFMPLTVVHPLYMSMYKQQSGEIALDRGSLSFYLKADPAFVGISVSTRVGSYNTSCFVFDYDKLGRNLKKETDPDHESDQRSSESDTEKGEEDNQENLPF